MYTKTALALAAALAVLPAAQGTGSASAAPTAPPSTTAPPGASAPPAATTSPGVTAPPAATARPGVTASPGASGRPAPSGTVLGTCGPGRLCLWPKPDFKGRPWTHELATTDIDSCVALPPGTSAQSLANRTGRPVTTYQSAECGETGEFETYPGRGTWAPQTAYEVRAFKLWER
ncbi:peptidase inhibitor family I36 protein [Streptomyces sp. NPDC014746]|uniref:peptidase inhibitor family I36 protein n=1 Tax=Streptomyces sp. NPDC014746 TaxID=3364904 RepID=UPI0036F985EF